MKKALLAITASLAIAPAMAATQIDDWIYIESKDSITDEDRSFALNGTVREHLGVLCQQGEAKLLFTHGTYMGGTDSYSVTYRVDSNAPGQVSASPSTHGKSLFLNPSLMDEMAEGASIVLRVENRAGTPLTRTFSLIGFYDATGLLSCVGGEL